MISARCAAETLAQVGAVLSPEEVLKRFLGRSRREIAEESKKAGFVVPEDFVERLEGRIHDVFESELRAVKGVEQVLSAIPYPICVASGSSLAYIRHALALTHLDRFFGDNLFSAAMVARPKPAPDVFLYAAASLHTDPTRCLVVEDSMSGITAARAAGMAVVGFTGGSHLDSNAITTQYLDAGCVAVFESMHELGTYLHEIAD